MNAQTEHVVDNNEGAFSHGLEMEDLGKGVRLILVYFELTNDHDEDPTVHRRLRIDFRHNHVHRLNREKLENIEENAYSMI